MTAMLDHWPAPTDFVRDALCAQVDSETFFPQKELGLNTAREAKRICGMCNVRNRCAEYAITLPTNPEGIWGGLSMRERAEIRAERGIRDEAYDTRGMCGTNAGAMRHYRNGETPCGPCLQAARIFRDKTRRRA